MRYVFSIVLFLLCFASVVGQSELEKKTAELIDLQEKEQILLSEIEALKLQATIEDMKLVGLPEHSKSLDVIEHSGMVIGFDCDFKMASWVFHVLTADVTTGNVSRSNDFRKDDVSSCSSAEEADYFLRIKQDDGKTKYDGFGYDRGHLAPSADFKWSESALSESYYYSNMTPQHPSFNRGAWASLEGTIRKVVDREKKKLFIVTGPLLHDSLPVQERSVNKLKIPAYHYKIIVDASQNTPRGMAFLMPNKKCENRLSSYVISIDSLERLTGIDFFPALDDTLEVKIESKADFSAWQVQGTDGDVEPLDALALPKGYFNTLQAASKVGRKVSIVGKVVSTKFIPKSESTFLNLDQSFPNQIFSIMIWKDGRRNFSYQPEKEFDGKYIVVTGKVELDKNDVPGITVMKEEQIEIWEEE